MRFLYAAVAALCAVVASAQQNNAISIPEGQSTLDVTAGTTLNIQWTNPSSGTVTIKLVQQPVTPDSGFTLASAIPASDGTATLQIPAADEVNSFQYTIEIIDDTDTTNINFSPNFGIKGATGTATGSASTASSTGSVTSTGTSSGTASRTSSGTSSGTSSATDSSTITSTESSSSASTESSSSETSASTTSDETSSSTTSSAAPTESTTAPDSSGNAASGLKVQGSLLAMAVGLIAVV